MPTGLDPDFSTRNILMRITEHGDLVTKGSELANTEVDNNFIILYETLKSIFINSGVYDYDADKSYSQNNIAIINEIVYLSLVDGNEGNTPGVDGSEEFWGLCSLGDMINIMFGSTRTFNVAQFESMKNNGLLKAGSFYIITGFSFQLTSVMLIVQATGTSTVSGRAARVNAENEIMEADLSDSDSANWIVKQVYHSEQILNLGATGTFDGATNKLTIPDGYIHIEKIILSVDDYDAEATYSENQLARDPDTGLVWKSKEDDNTGNPLEVSASPDAWEYADADEDNVGRVLIEKVAQMSDVHRTKYEVTGITAKFKATAIAEAGADQIMLDLNTDAILGGDGFLELDTVDGKRRKTGGSLLN